MRALLCSLLICASALPAYAGQATIVETDDEIIVEYSGDASDKAADKSGDKVPEAAAGATTVPAPNQGGSAVANRPPVDNPPIAGKGERPSRSQNRRDRTPRQYNGGDPPEGGGQ